MVYLGPLLRVSQGCNHGISKSIYFLLGLGVLFQAPVIVDRIQFLVAIVPCGLFHFVGAASQRLLLFPRGHAQFPAT